MHKNKFDRKKILIVEDDESILSLINEALIQAGFRTEQASSVNEAFDKIDKFEPDLVLSDHDMPQMTGLDMLVQLRKNENYVSVIFVSGRSDLKTICDALELGADDYIRKPVCFEELVARIKNCLRIKEVHEELKKTNEKLQEMLEKDHLTGLYNMCTMYERIDFELARARRYGRQVAAIMIDMDHFKTINDDNDHLFGSFVLAEMGRIFQKFTRDTDLAARYGGDEFLIVLTEVDREGTISFCERLRSEIENHIFENEDFRTHLTISMGYSITSGKEGVNSRVLTRYADHALYEAKAKGRNQTIEYIPKN